MLKFVPTEGFISAIYSSTDRAVTFLADALGDSVKQLARSLEPDESDHGHKRAGLTRNPATHFRPGDAPFPLVRCAEFVRPILPTREVSGVRSQPPVDDAHAAILDHGMLDQDPPARLPQIRDEDFTEETHAFFGQWTGGIFNNADQNPVLRTFAHHPVLANAFSPLNIHLLGPGNTLPIKLRQLAIMRTAWVTKATYMWSSHLNTSKLCGLTDEFYGPIQRGADDPYFTPFEATVIRATEELIREQKISDANWNILRAEWTEKQLLDLMFTVGCYTMVAGVMRSTGAERQGDLLALAERYGSP